MKNKKSKFGILALYLSTIIFASNTYLFRLAGQAMPEHLFIGLRFLAAGLLMKLIFRGRPKLTRGAYILIFLMSVFGEALATYLFVHSASRTPLLTIGMIGLLGPILVLILATAIHQETLTKRSILSIVVAGIGALVLVLKSSSGAGGGVAYDPLGPIYVTGSVVIMSGLIVISKKVLKKVDAIQFTYLQFMFGSVPFIAYSLLSGDLAQVSDFSVRDAAIILVAISTNGILPFALRAIGIKAASLSVAAQQSYVSLVAIAVIAILFLREPVSTNTAIGCALVVIGISIGQPRLTIISMLHHLEYDIKHVALALARPDLTLKQIIKKV